MVYGQGHCAQHPDQLESFVKADKLSRVRAESVAAFMHSRGVPYAQILPPSAKGTGCPMTQNQDEAGRRRNRLVHYAGCWLVH